MDDTKLLGKIGKLIDTKLSKNLKPINEKLGILDSKVGALDRRMDNVETKVGTLDKKIDSLDIKIEIVSKKIDKAQEETIEVLSELITSGHNIHEKRLKRIEDHLQLPQTQ